MRIDETVWSVPRVIFMFQFAQQLNHVGTEFFKYRLSLTSFAQPTTVCRMGQTHFFSLCLFDCSGCYGILATLATAVASSL